MTGRLLFSLAASRAARASCRSVMVSITIRSAPACDTGAHRLGKDIHRLLKAEGASGLQQLRRWAPRPGPLRPAALAARRAHLHRGEGPPPPRCGRSRPSFSPVGAEGVGAEDLGPRLHIGPVDVLQPVRVFQGGQLGPLAPWTGPCACSMVPMPPSSRTGPGVFSNSRNSTVST